jgi:nucleoside-diphosphate-sugar epimerase
MVIIGSSRFSRGKHHTLRDLGDLMSKSLAPIFAETRVGDVKHSLAAIERAENLLGYQPSVGWRDGLQLTAQAYHP